jgi:hypothetical protein
MNHYAHHDFTIECFLQDEETSRKLFNTTLHIPHSEKKKKKKKAGIRNA